MGVQVGKVLCSDLLNGTSCGSDLLDGTSCAHLLDGTSCRADLLDGTSCTANLLEGKSYRADLLIGFWEASGFDQPSENGFWLLKSLYETNDFLARLGGDLTDDVL